MGNFHLVSGGIILVYSLLPIKKLRIFTFSLPLPTRWIAKRKAMKMAAIKVNELII